MKIGARIIKTGIAVTFTMLICKALNLEPAFFGAVSAVINMQPSIFLTIKTAKDQIMVQILGVSVAIFLGYIIGGNAISMGLITILIILLYRKVNLQSGISAGVVAAVFILSSSPDEFLPHALRRTAVIFTGLTTAMFVNIVLWPPKYNRQFKEKLKESNEQAVLYFCQAVQDYIQLENDEPNLNEEQRNKVHAINAQLRELSGLFRREGNLFATTTPEQGAWFSCAKKFIDYNEALTEKADRIYNLLPARFERRLKSGSPPISSEFKTILEMLQSGCITITRVNGKLRSAIIEGLSVESEKISEDYWEKMTKAIELWQPKITSSYYLHALIEVAVMANEIKGAARQGKKLLDKVRLE